jgi:hypothetical protein
MNRLKNIITAKDVNINPKHGHGYTVPCLANHAYTTNNNNVKIDVKDRRFVVFECSSTRTGDTSYFDRLWAAIEVCTVSPHKYCIAQIDPGSLHVKSTTQRLLQSVLIRSQPTQRVH